MIQTNKISPLTFKGFTLKSNQRKPIAKLFMDAADPAGFSPILARDPDVMVQMATLDVIVPNDYTRKLADLADVPRRDYLAEHAFLALPIEPEYLRGTSEMARFLTGDFQP